MSQLESGETYIYERDGHRVYARKPGGTDRILIGYDYDHEHNSGSQRTTMVNEWLPILEAAEHNAALQHALERAKIIYELSKQQDPLFHHPV